MLNIKFGASKNATRMWRDFNKPDIEKGFVILMWEQKFIKYIVTRYKDHCALGGLGFDNKCSVILEIEKY